MMARSELRLDFEPARSQFLFSKSMISVAHAQQQAQAHLQGFPPAIIDAYLGFADTGDHARLDEVVLGILQFYLAKPPAVPLATLPGDTRLIEDLGCDSLTMADLLFIAETLFGITLVDAEVARITTLDELREYFRGSAGSSAKHGA